MISDTKARKAKPREKAYRIADAGGLALEVRPSGSKIWRYRYRLNGTPGMYTIGEYPGVTIAEARERRDWARKAVADGESPREAEKRELLEHQSQPTLQEVAQEWIDTNAKGWSDYYLKQVRRGIEEDICPSIGHLPVREVSSSQILAILKSVEQRGAPSVALLIRQWLSAIYRYAITTLRADNDPTMPVQGAVKRQPTKHKASLNLDEFQVLVRKLWGEDGRIAYRITEIAIQLLALTIVRTGEMRQATWDQFQGDTWTIPAGSMKRKRPHVVPLSDQAQALLKELEGWTGGRTFLFPNMRDPDKPMSATTINRVLERMGYSGIFSGHAFRTTASTLLNSHGWDADWIERQLAHQAADRTRASYNHAQYLHQRRAMMQWWADLTDILRQHDRPALPPLPAIARPGNDPDPPGASASPMEAGVPEERSLH